MNVLPGGLAGVMGSMSFEGSRSAGAVDRAPAVKQAPAPAPAQKATGGFEAGLLHARAVTSPEKTQSTLPPPNPNLPRGSVIDLKV